MKRFLVFITLAALLLLASACTEFSNSVDPVINQVPDDRLNDAAQVNFLINGVQVRFATALTQVMTLSSGLSDEFIFDARVPNATFPTFRDIDQGAITLDNNSVDGAYNPLGELRFFADDLIRRVGTISGVDAATQKRALFTGYLYGGIARYLYAAYFGLNPADGGGVIDNGPFIPSQQMYDLALEKLQLAVTNAPAAADARVANSIIARLHLVRGNFAAARTAATAGMVSPDPAFQGKYSTLSTNFYWQQAGLGRPQYVADARFLAYVTADPAEKSRIALSPITGNDAAKTVFQRQAKYATESTPIDFMSWQENELMQAELDVRGGNAGAALTRVNAVRASHTLAALAAIDLDGIYVERDKELFVTGVRLLDQRRFNKFHLPAGSWQFLPITDDERNNNPNF
ncbi:MAG: hypothetical protein ALAOOOJD_02706 [bacterium]|nr:hypothetical protein [bacterium]